MARMNKFKHPASGSLARIRRRKPSAEKSRDTDFHSRQFLLPPAPAKYYRPDYVCNKHNVHMYIYIYAQWVHQGYIFTFTRADGSVFQGKYVWSSSQQVSYKQHDECPLLCGIPANYSTWIPCLTPEILLSC